MNIKEEIISQWNYEWLIMLDEPEEKLKDKEFKLYLSVVLELYLEKNKVAPLTLLETINLLTLQVLTNEKEMTETAVVIDYLGSVSKITKNSPIAIQMVHKLFTARAASLEVKGGMSYIFDSLTEKNQLETNVATLGVSSKSSYNKKI